MQLVLPVIYELILKLLSLLQINESNAEFQEFG